MKRAMAVLIVLAIGLWGCGESESPEPPEPAGSSGTTAAQSTPAFTVAEAKKAVWPPPGGGEIDQLDPMPTRANYLAVLDMSGSMRDADCAGQYPSKAEAARAALDAWLRSIPEEANIGLVIFASSEVKLAVPLGVDNRRAFMAAAEAAQPSGKTPLKDALSLARAELERRARYQQGYGDYRIVVITDGMHSDGQDPRPEVDAILGNPANPILIYTIGFCIEGSALHQPGRTVYQSARSPEELTRGLQRVLAESQAFDVIKEFEAQ